MTRTTVGIDFCAQQLASPSASATAIAKYIGVSNNTNAANVANTATNTTATRICWGTAQPTDAAASTTRGEYTALGFTRAAGVYAHTASTSVYTVTITFTASSAFTALQACGIFDTTTQNTGNLFCENVFTATSGISGDQLTIAWTFNL